MTTTPNIPVALLLGDPDGSGGASRVEELKLTSPITSESVVEQLAAAGVSPADVRARVELVIPPEAGPVDAAVLHATLAGYIGRFLPVRLSTGEITPIASTANIADRPDHIDDHIDITADSDLTDPQVHYARRATLILDGLDAKTALELLNKVAAVRRRPRFDRLPDIAVEGTEEPIRLEDARKAGLTYRGAARGTSAGTVIDHTDPSPRLNRLESAAQAPITETLLRLGATHDESGEKWHCTRPDRHNNGDQNPSLKIVEGKTRCFRCDPEWVDSLRLVIDTLNLTPDEAAEWIESGEQLPALH